LDVVGTGLTRPTPDPALPVPSPGTPRLFESTAWGHDAGMSFDVSADAYARFMGRYSQPLAAQFVDALGLTTGQRVLDVGCGSGALTGVLVQRLGLAAVSAVDPSPSLVEQVGRDHPGIDVRLAGAEALPFQDSVFDGALAQLVVQFMADPERGIVEMARTVRPGGVVAASVWDHGAGSDRGPLSLFWRAAASLDTEVADESDQVGVAEGQLVELFERAGLARVHGGTLTVVLDHPTFEDWWEPFTLGVGPAGAYYAGLGPAGRDVLRERCRQMQPPAPFQTRATAWIAVGRRPPDRGHG
jgi:SAM-dependent methyltransferase